MLNSIHKNRFFAGHMSSTLQRMTVPVDGSQSLPNQSLSLYLKSGVAWITSNGNDIILNTGDSLFIKADKRAPVISSLTELPITFEIEVI